MVTDSTFFIRISTSVEQKLSSQILCQVNTKHFNFRSSTEKKKLYFAPNRTVLELLRYFCPYTRESDLYFFQPDVG